LGTSNAGPWGGHTRSTDTSEYGQYTNAHTASQLAFNADTGKIAWAYQTTPADVWDYDAVNEAVLTDLTVGGRKIPALLKADRNGFFYVLNRENGQLISAEPFVHLNWAKAVDKATGRPVEDPRSDRSSIAGPGTFARISSAARTGSRCRTASRRASSTFRPSTFAWTSRARRRPIIPASSIWPRNSTSTKRTVADSSRSSKPGIR